MKIIVLVKQTLDPKGITVRRDKERLFINREDYIVEQGSKAAIEAALRLVRQDGEIVHAGKVEPALEHPPGVAAAEVIAVSMGRPQADEALREALAMGCDSAILLSDQAFAQADISVTVHILARAVEKLGGADLVVAGQASADTGGGQIGPRLAEALGYAQVTEVYACRLEGDVLHTTRRWGQSYATVEVRLPAVVTVSPEAFPPRYPHGARIMSAYRDWQVRAWDATALELQDADLRPLLAFRGESFPPPLELGEVLRGDPADLGREAVTALRLQKLVE
jgi:electron transfer flavoprotein beta subunit